MRASTACRSARDRRPSSFATLRTIPQDSCPSTNADQQIGMCRNTSAAVSSVARSQPIIRARNANQASTGRPSTCSTMPLVMTSPRRPTTATVASCIAASCPSSAASDSANWPTLGTSGPDGVRSGRGFEVMGRTLVRGCDTTARPGASRADRRATTARGEREALAPDPPDCTAELSGGRGGRRGRRAGPPGRSRAAAGSRPPGCARDRRWRSGHGRAAGGSARPPP